MEKLTIPVEGMHCAACELRIEKELLKLKGVNKAKASCGKAVVRVEYDQMYITREQIELAVSGVGYIVSQKAQPERMHGGTLRVVGILVIIVGVYLLISNTIGFNFIPEVKPETGLGVIFVVGLLTSLHCLAMCGGINLSQNVSSAPGSMRTRLIPGLKYNAGRVLAYTTVGGVAGAIGSVISFSSTAKGVVVLAAGILMILMGLNMLELPWLKRVNLHMPKFLRRKAGTLKSSGRPFVVGLLNGLMPCGPLQAMQIYALGTGGFLMGALSMMMFALGTVPLMFAFGALSALLNGRFTRVMGKVSAVLVILIGFMMLGRGFGLSGVALTKVLAEAGPQIAATADGVEEDVQRISTAFRSGQYAPITVKEGLPVIWTITVTQDDLNGCNNPVVIPEYGIEKKLVPGDNTIEFTPTNSGVIAYSCWMGMIRSTITMLEADG
jgi:sulfite exporter TauE/SafE